MKQLQSAAEALQPSSQPFREAVPQDAGQTNEAIEQILELGFLGAIAKDDLLSLRPAPTLVSVKTGETLIWQGESGQAYFLLLRGRLRRFVNDEFGRRRFVGDVVPGQGIGASGLLTDAGNASTVRVMHDSEVVRFPRATFLQMMVLSWEFAIGVSREQIERVRAGLAAEGQQATIKTIAVVPLDATVDQQSFVDSLSEAVGPFASIAAADRSLMAEPGLAATEAEPHPSGKAQMDAVISRLEALERRHDVVLYQASPPLDAWTRLIIGRADLVLLVASVGGACGLCEIETALIEPTERELLPRIDLAIIHDCSWNPECRARDWLDVRHVDEWHHLRLGRREDFQRLARVLTGNAITLVLGGGGARGVAEVGVVKALQQAGIPIDRIAGTSMGALIGAQVAAGKDADAIVVDLKAWVAKGRPGKDYTYPALSLVHGRKAHEATHDLIGDGSVEDLPIPFFCLSANLSENRAVVHDRGSLWRSVRASISVPGIGPPLFDSGRVLVDGATVNNIPADVVASRHAGRIIIVDVSIPQKLAVPESYNDLVPSGWQILWHRINPFLEPLQVPSIYEVLGRASVMGGQASNRRAREIADLSILPPMSSVGLADFTDMDQLIDLGYKHAVAQLTSIGKEGLQQLFPGVATIRPETVGAPTVLPPIDRAQFNEILGLDDDKSFREMLGFFLEMFPKEIACLELAISKSDSAEIRAVAHRAKSAAINVAAPALTAFLQGIEDRSRNGKAAENCSDVWAEFRRIEAYYDREARSQ
jgi:predicted acylesterase/phospholipase RssA/CRP-like cAMP-binding protein/HPt (histidine-containing phosphotransfer) domain-containing protein